MRSYLFAAVAFTILCSMCTAAWCQEAGASPFSARIEGAPTNPPTSNIWTYTVFNTSSCADYAVWMVGIELDVDTTYRSITTPDGWSYFDDDPNYICLFTTGPDMAADSSQSGFVVEFNQMPQSQAWGVAFNNIQTGEAPYDFGTVTSAAVPEPGSIITLLLGLSSLAALAKKRRS